MSAKSTTLTIGSDKQQRAVTAKQVVDAGAAAEVDQVGTAAHADMLAMVDQLARGRIAKRRRAPAQGTPRLDELHSATRFRQGHRRRHACQASANDDHSGAAVSLNHAHGAGAPATGAGDDPNNSQRVAIRILRHLLKRTRADSTSPSRRLISASKAR